MTDNQSDFDVMEDLDSSDVVAGDKVHPWRICPIGKHYVRTHVLHIPPSKEHPQGEVVTRHAHCAENPLRNGHKDHKERDLLSYDELQIIAKAHFSDLGEGPPKSGVLTKFPRADEFDQHIRGWVRYWNEVFQAKDPLDPNLVKALIASESSFKPELNNPTGDENLGDAHGLMQLLDATLGFIAGHKGGVKDHFIYLNPAEAMDPSANICAGVRWLFMKRAIAVERFNHAKSDHVATWDDAVAEYKGLLKDIIDKKDNPDPLNEMPTFRHFYEQLLGL